MAVIRCFERAGMLAAALLLAAAPNARADGLRVSASLRDVSANAKTIKVTESANNMERIRSHMCVLLFNTCFYKYPEIRKVT